MSAVYQIITDRILGLLEKGTIPWKKPWNSSVGLPKNLVSKKEYRGVNTFLLGALSYEVPYFLTFNQAKELGGAPKKGEKGCPVAFWKMLDGEIKDGKKEKIPLLRYYTVFNVSQCEGIPESKLPKIEKRNNNPIEDAEKIVSEMQKAPKVVMGMSRAAYCPSLDVVEMPDRNAFKDSESYYSTLFHELTHSTGHKSRLNRKGITEEKASFGTQSYGKEELVAEMGASFLCGTVGIINSVIEDNAAYLAGWISRIKEDPKLVVNAAGAAQKAADFILGRKFENE